MEGEGVVESEGEGWEWWGLMKVGWRGLMEGCWTSSPFVVVPCWCHLLATACQHCRTSLLPLHRISWPCCCCLCCCPCAVSLSSAHCCSILYLNEVGQEEGGMGGTYLESTTTNDICHSDCHVTVTFPASGGRSFSFVGVVFTHGWSFAFVGGCVHSQVVICIHRWSFSLTGGRFHTLALVGGRFHSYAISFVVECGWRRTPCCGCCGQHHFVLVVVVDGREKECHML